MSDTEENGSFNKKGPAGNERLISANTNNPNGMNQSAPGSWPQTAVGAVVFRDNRVLLVKRGRPPNKGIWTLPGGRVKSGETLQKAAEREILEETGIVIRAGSPIYVFDYIEKNKIGHLKYHYVIIDLAADYVSGDLNPGDDAEDAAWIAAEKLIDLGVNQRVRDLLKDHYGFG